jgi:hypothetical protein
MPTIPKKGDPAETFIKGADERLEGIRKLGAKPEQRYFGIGPKKGPLNQNDQLLKKELERNELSMRSEGMRLKRNKTRSTSRAAGRK